jgi:hypothetical protein
MRNVPRRVLHTIFNRVQGFSQNPDGCRRLEADESFDWSCLDRKPRISTFFWSGRFVKHRSMDATWTRRSGTDFGTNFDL